MTKQSILAVRNRAYLGYDQRVARGTFTGTTGTWSGLDQLGRFQIPYFARVTPDGGTARVLFTPNDADDDPEDMEITAVSIHFGTQRPPVGSLIRFLDDSALIAAVTYTGGPVASAILTEPATVGSLDVSILSAGSDEIWIAAVGAWQNSLRFNMPDGWREETEGLGNLAFSPGGTPHVNARPQARITPVSFRSFGEAAAFGIGRVHGDVGWPAPWGTDNSDTSAGSRYTFAAASGTLLAETGALESGVRYRAAVYVEQSSNTIPGVVFGSVERALNDGGNVVEAVADGTDLSIEAISGSSFTGAVTLLALEEIEDPRAGDDAAAVFETEADRPCLWIPRNEQAWRDRQARYGILLPGGLIQHVQADLFDVSFRIREGR